MRKKTRLKKRELTTIALVSLMLFLVFAVASVSAECPAGMVSYWKLDEGSGITAFDSVSTYQNGLNGLGCEELVVPATIDIDPNTLNPKSKGKWITAYIELPEGYDVSSIDVGTVMLNDLVPAEPHPTEIGDYDDDGIADLMVKFDMAAVQEILEGGDEVEIIVAGELTDGTPFEGSDTISVIDKCKEINFDLSMEFLGSEGTTIADANGLTFNIDGMTWTQSGVIYDEQYWGTYPLYRPGSFIVVRLTITNKGKEPEAGFDIECTAFQMNTDGSNGASIMTTPQTRNIRVANGETKTIDIIFPLPFQAKNLNKFIVSIYTEGTLRMAKEGIFCPPEELK